MVAAMDLSVGQKRNHTGERCVDCDFAAVVLVKTMSAGKLHHERESSAVCETTSYPLLSVITL